MVGPKKQNISPKINILKENMNDSLSKSDFQSESASS